jgi:hypothetical protein
VFLNVLCIETAIIDLQEKGKTLYASIEKTVASLSSAEADTNVDHKTIHGIMDEIQKLRGHESLIEAEDSYTPMTKAAMVEGVKKRKVELGKMAKTLFSEK